jgi:hypothetical protein
MSRSGRSALPRRRARSLAPPPGHGPNPGRRRRLGRPRRRVRDRSSHLRCAGGFTRPTGDLGLQLIRMDRPRRNQVAPVCSCGNCSRALRKDHQARNRDELRARVTFRAYARSPSHRDHRFARRSRGRRARELRRPDPVHRSRSHPRQGPLVPRSSPAPAAAPASVGRSSAPARSAAARRGPRCHAACRAAPCPSQARARP